MARASPPAHEFLGAPFKGGTPISLTRCRSQDPLGPHRQAWNSAGAVETRCVTTLRDGGYFISLPRRRLALPTSVKSNEMKWKQTLVLISKAKRGINPYLYEDSRRNS